MVQAFGNVIGKETYTEAMAELFYVCHIRLNDHNISTLFQHEQMWGKYILAKSFRSNFSVGVELKSFSTQDDNIDSGANVLSNNVELRITCQVCLVYHRFK